jgi:hypothetical protein
MYHLGHEIFLSPLRAIYLAREGNLCLISTYMWIFNMFEKTVSENVCSSLHVPHNGVEIFFRSSSENLSPIADRLAS